MLCELCHGPIRNTRYVIGKQVQIFIIPCDCLKGEVDDMVSDTLDIERHVNHRESYDEGYDEGYDKGHKEGHKEAQEEYQDEEDEYTDRIGA